VAGAYEGRVAMVPLLYFAGGVLLSVAPAGSLTFAYFGAFGPYNTSQRQSPITEHAWLSDVVSNILFYRYTNLCLSELNYTFLM
jgi:hypothetical protein